MLTGQCLASRTESGSKQSTNSFYISSFSLPCENAASGRTLKDCTFGPSLLSVLGLRLLACPNLSVGQSSRHTPSSLLTSTWLRSNSKDLLVHLVSFGMPMSQCCVTAMTPFVFCPTQHRGLITSRLHAIATPTSAHSCHRRDLLLLSRLTLTAEAKVRANPSRLDSHDCKFKRAANQGTN